MLPPAPFPLWGSTLYADLTAALWRALAAPWLAPGWQDHAGRGANPQPREGCAAAARPALPQVEPAPPGPGVAPTPEPVNGGQVIRVPHGRWRQPRERRRLPAGG
jgi:hypothetical protein